MPVTRLFAFGLAMMSGVAAAHAQTVITRQISEEPVETTITQKSIWDCDHPSPARHSLPAGHCPRLRRSRLRQFRLWDRSGALLERPGDRDRGSGHGRGRRRTRPGAQDPGGAIRRPGCAKARLGATWQSAGHGARRRARASLRRAGAARRRAVGAATSAARNHLSDHRERARLRTAAGGRARGTMAQRRSARRSWAMSPGPLAWWPTC